MATSSVRRAGLTQGASLSLPRRNRATRPRRGPGGQAGAEAAGRGVASGCVEVRGWVEERHRDVRRRREVAHRATPTAVSFPTLGRKIHAAQDGEPQHGGGGVGDRDGQQLGKERGRGDPLRHGQPDRGEEDAHQVQPAGYRVEAPAARLAVGRPRQLAVHRGVEEGGDRHRHCVGTVGTEQRPPGDEEEQVPQGRHDADPGETQELIGGDLVRADASQTLGPPDEEAPHPSQVARSGGDDVNARVGVVDPVDRDLPDAQAQPLRRHEQLGVEEPLVVLDEGQQLLRRVAA